ncbi:MAG: hypothetical protein VCA37_02470 [Roseibacillus sp.]
MNFLIGGGERREPAVTAGDDVFLAHNRRETDESLGDEFGVFHEGGGVRNDAGDGAGGKYGPDFTGSWRNGKDYFLESIVDPNAVIGENFRLNIVTRKDGSPVSGMTVGETAEVLTIQTLTESVAIPKSAIKSRQVLDQSIMPVGFFDTLPEQEVVDLLNYLTTE